MTKEEYLEMKKEYPNVRVEMFWAYWEEKKTEENTQLTFEEFSEEFQRWTRLPIVGMNLGNIANRVMEYFDKKFHVLTIINEKTDN